MLQEFHFIMLVVDKFSPEMSRGYLKFGGRYSYKYRAEACTVRIFFISLIISHSKRLNPVYSLYQLYHVNFAVCINPVIFALGSSNF